MTAEPIEPPKKHPCSPLHLSKCVISGTRIFGIILLPLSGWINSTLEGLKMDKRLESHSKEFLRHRHALMAFIYGMVRDPDTSEEIFQEVWVQLADAVELEQEINRVGAWCRSVARNLILERWRQRRLGKVLFNQDLLEKTERAFEAQESLGRHLDERRSALKTCLEEVPETSMSLLRMRYWEALPVEQVAHRSGRSAGGVKMALSRIRKGLADCVDRKIGRGE